MRLATGTRARLEEKLSASYREGVEIWAKGDALNEQPFDFDNGAEAAERLAGIKDVYRQERAWNSRQITALEELKQAGGLSSAQEYERSLRVSIGGMAMALGAVGAAPLGGMTALRPRIQERPVIDSEIAGKLSTAIAIRYEKNQLTFDRPRFYDEGLSFQQKIMVNVKGQAPVELGTVFADSARQSVELTLNNNVGGTKYSTDGTFGLTSEALKSAISTYTNSYGSAPKNLSGSLAWKNLENFQIEYAAARSANPSGTEGNWAETAVSRISFGKARIELGYSNFKVDANYMDNATINGKVYKDVPHFIEINAYRKN